MPPIKVDLDAVASGSGGGGNSIREDAFRKVLTKLVQPISKPEGSPDPRSRRPANLDVIPNRRHDAILVSARRGDGKTTFLTDILTTVQKAQGDTDILRVILGDKYPKEACNLYSLGIIDPTLVENKQNIVVLIIEKIKSAVDRYYQVVTPGSETTYQDFKRKLRELASGLNLLDGIGEDAAYGKDWADPDYILDAGLDRASAAGAFERSLHDYVAKACEFVKCDAFLLAIDDVDTWFERGWPVLEAMRKYLATPRLKIIMAGDINLYSLLVRQRQWKQITKEFVDIEAQSADGYGRRRQVERMVDTLQDQYLIKIAPLENRIDLKPLIYYINPGPIEFYASRSDTKPIPDSLLLKYYAERLCALVSKEDADPIREVLLRLPLRSGLQALAGAWRLISASSADDPDARQSALDSLRYVASTWMMGMDLDATAVRDAGPDRIFGILTEWMSTHDLWSTMPRFQPEGSDDGRNLVVILLAATLVDQFRSNASVMIDYWIRICTLREYVDTAEVNKAEIEVLSRHLKVGANETTQQFASRLASWEAGGGAAGGRQLTRGIRLSGSSVPATRLREPGPTQSELYGIEGSDSQKQVFAQTISDTKGRDSGRSTLLDALAPPLRGFHLELSNVGWNYGRLANKRTGIAGTLANSLESLRAQLDPDAATVLGLGAMQVTSPQQSENGIFSFLRILAAIGELIDLSRGGPVTEEAVAALLARLSQVRSYPAPSPAQADGQEPSASDDDGDTEEPTTDEPARGEESLARVLAAWLNSVSPDEMRRMALAPVTLARIWTRFTYAFASIRLKLQHLRTRYLGVLMHRTVIAFLHAVGVESLRASGQALGAKMVDNPIESSEPFLSLLKKIADLSSDDELSTHDHLLWFKFLFSCPLWDYFLAHSNEEIYGTSARAKTTHQVYDLYREYFEERCQSDGKIRVLLTDSTKASVVANFNNLYYALNSIQIQGQKSSLAADRSSAVASVLQELGAEPEALPRPRSSRAATAFKRRRSTPTGS